MSERIKGLCNLLIYISLKNCILVHLRTHLISDVYRILARRSKLSIQHFVTVILWWWWSHNLSWSMPVFCTRPEAGTMSHSLFHFIWLSLICHCPRKVFPDYLIQSSIPTPLPFDPFLIPERDKDCFLLWNIKFKKQGCLFFVPQGSSSPSRFLV